MKLYRTTLGPLSGVSTEDTCDGKAEAPMRDLPVAPLASRHLAPTGAVRRKAVMTMATMSTSENTPNLQCDLLSFGSLFSGVGGLDIGLERAGWHCSWQVESDWSCQRVLAKHWPNVPRWGDIRTVTADDLSPVGLLAGGFPCPDISNAHTNGQRLGLAGAQSGLWYEFRRLVEALEPAWVLTENVAAWKRWVPVVRSDLHTLGYASLPVQLSAGSFGAPHKRPRVFVVAHANGKGEPLRSIHAEVARLSPVPRGGGDWRSPPPGGFRVGDGATDDMDRLRVLGNAVVPQVGQWLGEQIRKVA